MAGTMQCICNLYNIKAKQRATDEHTRIDLSIDQGGRSVSFMNTEGGLLEGTFDRVMMSNGLRVRLTKFALIPRVERHRPNLLCVPTILFLAQVPVHSRQLAHL